MDRRQFLGRSVGLMGIGLGVQVGCRSHRYGHVLTDDQPDMVGSHTAGAETYKVLIDEAVGNLLAQCGSPYTAVVHTEELPLAKRICFVGVENRSSEELGDFRDQIYQLIDTHIVQSEMFDPVSKRFIDAALRETRLRAGDLFLPQNQRALTAALERQGYPFDYLLFATVTSGTTKQNKDYQRDYLLTLEMIDIHTGRPAKATASLRKGYHKTRLGKFRIYNPFTEWR